MTDRRLGKAFRRGRRILQITLFVFLLLIASPYRPNISLSASRSGQAGWSYRKSHIINPAPGAGTNYQVQIVTYAGSGTDSGNAVYLNNHARSDFGDVRFTGSDGSTLLNYWQEANYSISGLTKYGNNPILTSGHYASVVYDWQDATFDMYYTFGSPSQIYRATSFDGKTWTKDEAHSHVFAVGSEGKFDDEGVSVPVVWIEGPTWYMLYTGLHGYRRSVGLAESTDGLTWTRQNNGDAVFGSGSGWDSGDTEAATVMKVGSTYYMYFSCTSQSNHYAGGRGIGIATSTNLLTWTEDSANPIFEGGRFTPSGVIKRNGYYYLFVPHYTGVGSSYANVELWRDTAPTFYRNSRVLLGIAINYGAAGAWDGGSHALDSPFVMTDDVTRSTFSTTRNQLWVYYSSVSGGEGLTVDTNIDTALDGATAYATFWVQVSGDLTAGPVTIYVQYGNSEATSTSNGPNTFPILFSHFTSAPSNLGEGAFQITNGTLLDTNGIGKGSKWHGPRGTYSITGQGNFRFRYSASQVATYAGLEREVIWFLDSSGNIIYWCCPLDYSYADARTQFWAYTQTGANTDFEGDPPSGATQFVGISGQPIWSDGQYLQEFLRAGSIISINYSPGSGNELQLLSAYSGDQTVTTSVAGVAVGIQGYSTGPEITTHQIDWMFLSKYVNPEPTHGSWGNEEHLTVMELLSTSQRSMIQTIRLTSTSTSTSTHTFPGSSSTLITPEYSSTSNPLYLGELLAFTLVVGAVGVLGILIGKVIVESRRKTASK